LGGTFNQKHSKVNKTGSNNTIVELTNDFSGTG